MKLIVTSFLALFAGVLANPVPAETSQLSRRGANLADVFAAVNARVAAAVAICADAKVDVNASIDVRAAVAARLKADLDACAALLAEATARVKASAKAEVLEANRGCDAKCIEKSVVDATAKVCGGVDVIVKKLGEDCVRDYVKPIMVNVGVFTKCLDGLFIGVGASVAAAIRAALGASLSLALGLNLDLDLVAGIGAILGIGR